MKTIVEKRRFNGISNSLSSGTSQGLMKKNKVNFNHKILSKDYLSLESSSSSLQKVIEEEYELYYGN